MNILYIDDDPDDRDVFKEAVAAIDTSITCYLAHNGQDGLDTLHQLITQPDYIFVDLNMPVKSGKEFLIEIKNTVGFRTIPVILYSTTSRPDEIKSYSQLGARDFIIKPNTFGEICQILTATLLRGERIGLLSKLM